MMIETSPRQKIEVLVDAPFVPQLVRFAEEAGITGHTLIRTESGRGRHGEWSEDLISGATAKYVFLTIASNENAARFLDLLDPLLESHGLIVLRSAVDVTRPGLF